MSRTGRDKTLQALLTGYCRQSSKVLSLTMVAFLSTYISGCDWRQQETTDTAQYQTDCRLRLQTIDAMLDGPSDLLDRLEKARIALANQLAQAKLDANLHPEADIRAVAATCLALAEQARWSFFGAPPVDPQGGTQNSQPFDYQRYEQLRDLDHRDQAQHMVNKLLREFRLHGAGTPQLEVGQLLRARFILLSLRDTPNADMDQFAQLAIKLEQQQISAKLLRYPDAVTLALEGSLMQTAEDLRRFIQAVAPKLRDFMRKQQVINPAAQRAQNNTTAEAARINEVDTNQATINQVALNQATVNQEIINQITRIQIATNQATTILATTDEADTSEGIIYPNPWLLEKTLQSQINAAAQTIGISYSELETLLLPAMASWFDVDLYPLDTPRWHSDVTNFGVYSDGLLLGELSIDVLAREGKQLTGLHSLQRGVADKQITQSVYVGHFSSRKQPLSVINTFDVIDGFGSFIYQIHSAQQPWWGDAGLSAEPEFTPAVAAWFREWFLKTGVLQHTLKDRGASEEAVMAWIQSYRDYQWVKAYQQLLLADAKLALLEALKSDTLQGKTTNADVQQLIITQLVENNWIDGSLNSSEFSSERNALLADITDGLVRCDSLCYEPVFAMALTEVLFEPIAQSGPFNKETVEVFKEKIMVAGSSRSGIDLASDYLQRPLSIQDIAKHYP